MRTEPHSFFHGTSAYFASRILVEGARDYLSELRAHEIATDLYKLLLAHVAEWTQLRRLFEEHGSECYSSAPRALQNVAQQNARTSFSYGSFYVSMNAKIAVGYACRGAAGSELLLFIREAIRVLRARADAGVEALVNEHRPVMALLARPAEPVVLEVRGLSRSQLESADGDPNRVEKLVELQLSFGDKVRLPASFRANRVDPSNIVAVYPLTRIAFAEPGEFDRDAFDRLRMEPSAWLARR